MASANVSLEDLELSQLESVRAEIRKRVARAHQVLQERETALLSELQMINLKYLGMGTNKQIYQPKIIKKKFFPALKDNEYRATASDGTIRVELEWDGSLEGILRGTGSIRVSGVPNFKEKGNLVMVAAKSNKKRKQAASETSPTCGKNKRFSTASSHKYGTHSTSQNVKTYNGSSTNYCHNTTTHISPNHTSKTSRNSPNFIITELNKLPRHNTPRQAIKRMVNTTPIRGLKNLGNTCFMNSVIQCLSHTLPLRQFYVSNEYKQYLNNRGDLSNAFKRVMVELWVKTMGNYVDPCELKKQVGIVAPRFIGYNQHDAHEFMRFLLNELHEEINRASVEGRKSPADNETLEEACARYLTWEDSRISELFGGMLWSEVCCSVCSNLSTVYIPFMDIALPIPELSYSGTHNPAVHLTDCLNMLTTKETLDEEERPYCNKCMNLTKSTKQLSIAKLPRFLVIQLKRFSYIPKRTKLSTHVKFDQTWKLVDSANKLTHIYSLYGIVSHSGSIYGGHYTAYCNYNGTWRCFDDTMTRHVSWEHVKDQEAYILFYEKVEDML